MQAAEVTALVLESASRFGDRNTQQLAQLSSRFGKCAQEEVSRGLVQVFTQGPPPPEGSRAQELAGQLLAALCPKGEVELGAVLGASLGRYELSVEQFPHYLRSVFGAEQVLNALQELERGSLSEQERRALHTMRFWLGSPRSAGAQNGA